MDFLAGALSMFGPKSDKDAAYDKVLQIVHHDEESDEAPYACERIIRSAWEHSMRAAHDPAGVARSLPWDALTPPTQLSYGVRGDSVSSEGCYLDKLVKDSVILWDSDSGFNGHRLRKREESDEESDEEDSNECNEDVEVGKKRSAKNNDGRMGQRLTGEQLYEDHYVDRFLPGVVEPHPYDHRPTNAVAWSGTLDYDVWGEWEHFKELARAHPGDDPRHNEKISKEKSSAKDYDDKDFCPIVTKAGSRLWSISFVAPQSEENASCVDMKAVYPGQITIRYDVGRNFLIYDMFAFKPTTVHEFCKAHASGGTVCTEEELAQVRRLLPLNMKRKFGLDDQLTLRDRVSAIGKEKCCHLLNYVRFKTSLLMRIRFPLHSLRGARVLELDCKRPNSDLPVPEGLMDVSRLGEPGENGEAQGHETLERSDDEIESLGLMVLEFGDKCGDLLMAKGKESDANDATNSHPFASTVLWPRDWRDRTRQPIDQDWTPSSIFSRSRRHYIVGDMSEITELSNFLMSKSARLFNILSLPTDERYQAARKLLNSLSGGTSLLDLSQAPDDVFSDTIDVESKIGTSPQSVPALSKLCVEALVQSSGLRVQQNRERQFQTPDDVHQFLQRCGIDDAEAVNMCLKAGLLNGNMHVPKDLLYAKDASRWLSTDLLSEVCKSPMCGKTRSCTIRDVLYQSHCGSEEEREYEATAANCGGMFCSGRFVAGMCQGVPSFARLNHNHCTQCPDFGTCIGYYKNQHCNKCDYHYTLGRGCENCQAIEAKRVAGKTPEDNTSHVCDKSCWDGLINECPEHELVQGNIKGRLIKMLRQDLLMFGTMINMREGDERSALEEKVKADCPEFADEILNEHCHMNLDNKSVDGLFQIKACLS